MKPLLKFSNYALLFVAGGLFHKAIAYGEEAVIKNTGMLIYKWE